MGDASLRALADELGVALVAPQALDGDWRIPNRPRHRDDSGAFEFDYFRSLVDRLEQHHHVDRHKLLMAGFSTGGMLTWTLACHMGGAFAGFAPIAGTFWAPIPRFCPASSAGLMHFHGTSDDMVPLTGRAIADSRQGDVAAALALFAARGGFGAERPVPAGDGLSCVRRDNPKGQLLEFCSHPGSHGYKAGYLRRAWLAMHIGVAHGQ